MQPRLIKVGDSLIINPAHVAYAERHPQCVVLHMALEPGSSIQNGQRLSAAHPVLCVHGDEAAKFWESLTAETEPCQR